MAGQISLLDVDLVRFITMNFSKERNLYTYTGKKKLNISDEGKQQILQTKSTNYEYYRIDDRKKHFERIHFKFYQTKKQKQQQEQEQVNVYPVVCMREENKNEIITENVTITPIEYYNHEDKTATIDYRFSKKFIDYNNQFKNGYRDICLNALDKLTGRYSRFFFIYLSGDKYEFNFNEGTLRKYLGIENKYIKRNSISALLKGVKNELGKINIDFDYSYCIKSEWEEYKKKQDNMNYDPSKEGARKKNKKNKSFVKNFYFRAKGMEKYRIPKGMQSAISKDIAEKPEYRDVVNHFKNKLEISDSYITQNWQQIIKYINKYDAQTLIEFANKKMNEFRNQKNKPKDPCALLISLIKKAVEEPEAKGHNNCKQASVQKPSTCANVAQILDRMKFFTTDHPPNTS